MWRYSAVLLSEARPSLAAIKIAELRSAGQPLAAVPTWFVVCLRHRCTARGPSTPRCDSQANHIAPFRMTRDLADDEYFSDIVAGEKEFDGREIAE
jgi:hypothetical protein